MAERGNLLPARRSEGANDYLTLMMEQGDVIGMELEQKLEDVYCFPDW